MNADVFVFFFFFLAIKKTSTKVNYKLRSITKTKNWMLATNYLIIEYWSVENPQ